MCGCAWLCVWCNVSPSSLRPPPSSSSLPFLHHSPSQHTHTHHHHHHVLVSKRKGRSCVTQNSTDLLESLLNLYGLDNSKPTANPGGRSAVMELATAIPLDGHDYSNFRTAVGKLILIRHPTNTMQVLNPTTESKRAVKQLIGYLNGMKNTCLRLELHKMVQKGWLELVGRCDSDCAGDSATRQSVTENHCNVQGVTMCTEGWSRQQPASVRAKQSSTQRMRRRTVGSRRTSSKISTTTFQFVSRWIHIRHVPQRRGPGGPKH